MQWNFSIHDLDLYSFQPETGTVRDTYIVINILNNKVESGAFHNLNSLSIQRKILSSKAQADSILFTSNTMFDGLHVGRGKNMNESDFFAYWS